ncbi:hypothetical protein DMENIID0001_143360 [Sergentomyia squamirostris]
MEKSQTSGVGGNGGIFPQQCVKEQISKEFPDTTTPLRGYNFNGFNMTDLSHHLENDTVMSTCSSTSGGLVIDQDIDAIENGEMHVDAVKSQPKPPFNPTTNGQLEVFSTPKPRRRSSAWSGVDKTLNNTKDISPYFGMQPTVKFKCYKCLEANFLTLKHLKEHQQVCLQQKLPTEVTNGPNGRRNNGEVKSQSVDDARNRISRKLYLCSACGTYFENWNLFLHMREVHRKHICLLCLGMFHSAERLHHHLEGRHGILSPELTAVDNIISQINSQLFYLMCVTCEHVFTEHEQFTNHNCDTYLQPCALCNMRGSHKSNCKASVAELKLKRNGQISHENEQQNDKTAQVSQIPQPPDPIAELWKKYLNGDTQHENTVPPPPHEEPDKEKEEVVKPTEESPPRLLVPKLTVKIPKEFQTKLNSPDQSSSTDVESEDGEELNKSSEMSEDVTTPKMQTNVAQNVKADVQNENVGDVTDEIVSTAEVDVKIEDEEVIAEEQQENKDEAMDKFEVKKDEADSTEGKDEDLKEDVEMQQVEEEEYDDGIPVATDDAQIFDIRLNQPLDKIDMIELLKICLKQTIPFCLYCNHTTRIVVNAKYLAIHLIGTHRFAATVDSITAEELLPETIVARIKRSLDELDEIYVNFETFDSRDKENPLKTPCDRSFNCFQCRITARVHKELYQHNRKMHMKTVILCLMCKSALYSYSELLYHMCPGFTSTAATLDLRFRCGFCNLFEIPSAFRLMVHLRKKHHICEICLEDCGDQFKLSNHVWKHKLQHLCFRCGIVYRNKPDIKKHLFWKHGTESVTCKKCLQKKWPLVYHFCNPPAQFTCEHCPQIFTRAVALTVHRRLHTGDFKYPCEEENCDKKFISKKLLEKHILRHSQFIDDEPIHLPIEVKDSTLAVENSPPKSPKRGDATALKEKSEKKVKKTKSTKKDNEQKKINDLMDIDLPAPNLSESDSDMDVEPTEDSCDVTRKCDQEIIAEVETTELKSMDVVEEDEEEKAPPIVDIWENFKTYQTLQQQASKVDDEKDEDEEMEASVPFLHVAQSDHDYCSIYRVASKGKKEDTEGKTDDAAKVSLADLDNEDAETKSAESSDSSSGSDSSCTCESNCSCSTSSSSDSSTSSSSSDDENQGKVSKKKHVKKHEKSVKKENPEVIDVVTVEKVPDPDSNIEVFYESDLVTEQSDTDEDFYDEHPQRIAREMMMAWNRKFDDESREDGGTLAEDEAEVEVTVKREKVQKVKRKKKDKRRQKLPPLKLSLVTTPSTPNISQKLTIAKAPSSAPILSAALTSSTPLVCAEVQIIPGKVAPIKLSNGNDTPSGVKRSKRRRIPNKFYGYSSDEDTNSSIPHTPAMLKPTPPPNLVWRKEDLPQSSGSNAKSGSPGYQSLMMAMKPSPNSDFSTYNTPPPAQLPPQIFASTSPVRVESTTPSTGSIQPLKIPLIPPVVPVNRSYSDMAQLQTTSGDGQASASPDDDDDDDEGDESSSNDASHHLQIRDSRVGSSKPTSNNLRISLINRTAIFTNPPPPPRPPTTANIPKLDNNTETPGPKAPVNVYCYCRCPYDEVSEMIACDGDNCSIEWFHFECVGIMVPPMGKWYCPECKQKQPDTSFY